jgi:hypothetical protein
MPETKRVALIRRTLAALVLCAGLAASSAFAQYYPPPPGYGGPQGAQNPACPRLEAQLASLDRTSGEAARAEQLHRYEAAAGRQQAELNRVTQQARRMGCDGSGFFSIFGGQSAQCGPINNQIQQMRANLDGITRSLEQLRANFGASEQDGQRRAIILALAQNNCGPQYAAAARNAGSFLDDLFGGGHRGGTIMMPENMPQAGTYRTICVRSCDGYYFPISFATVPSRFASDEQSCKNLCPAADASLYTYRNPGEDMNSAVSLNGAPYTSLPAAFRYRQEYNPACSCRAPGQSWADALKSLDDHTSVERGDIIVTEERAKKLSQPPQAKGGDKRSEPAAKPSPSAATTTPAQGSQGSQQGIRSVGPTFIPAR